MTDFNPTPDAGAPTPVAVMSMQEVLALEQKMRENKAAQQRGDPLPHHVTAEQMRDAVMAIRRSRGTLDLYAKSEAGEKKSAAGKKSSPIQIDIDDL
jgi:hypothetical protein